MRRRLGIAAALGALALPAGAQASPGMLTIEGTFSYVQVKARGGDVVVLRRPARRHVRMLRHLPAGVYRVTAGETRAARCSRRVHVFSKGLTEVHVGGRPRRRCTMTRHALHARFPARRRIRAAQRYLRHRGGINSWSLIDSWGRMHGFAPHRVYVSASLVKAMLLTTYLRGIGNRMPDASARALLGPMITVSSNDAADSIYYRVGDAALYSVARLAHMTQFSVAGYWGNAHFSAEDQARLFKRIDRLVPKRSRAYARGLLSSIVSYQRWGFSRYAAAAGFRSFFKGGWRSTGAGQLVHEAALFERGDRRLSMAVLTDGNPSHDYGTETLRGVAERIFHRRGATAAAVDPDEAGTPATRRAGLVDVHRFAPGILVKLDYLGSHNLTGHRLPGYCENWALLHRRAASSLGQVERYLRRNGLGLLIMDAYRPLRATRALVRWAHESGRGNLVGSYIASRSRHNTGSAVDLTLVRLSDGKRLRMGGYDSLGPGANTYNASGRILRNRLTLKNAMEHFGFASYWREWWHFEHHIRPDRHLDLTLGCSRHN
jgi:zinc D-Ala-D-Ala dipeptidase